MNVDVVLLPRDLRPDHLEGKAVVVFDVLRATTSMTAALSAGVKEIRVFGDLESALAAGKGFAGPHLLVGERHAVKPAGFDLGNSPESFLNELYRDSTAFMTTTNGTRAILASKGASAIFAGALVNVNAVVEALIATDLDVTLLCSGTEGFICTEDTLGAGAVLDALRSRTHVEVASDVAWMALHLFAAQRGDLYSALADSRGGHNIKRAGLTPDIAFCAQLNRFNVVGVVQGDPPVLRRWEAAARQA